jgi:hypothetical protein
VNSRMAMTSAIDYPHLVVLGAVVAISTLAAGWWAEHRRHRMTPSQNMFGELAVALVFMVFYTFVVYLLPAIVVAYLCWWITSVPVAAAGPYTTADLALAETVVQLAALFSVGSNFADVASTFGRAGFWRHLRQYAVLVLPCYYATMAVAWLGAVVLASGSRFPPGSGAFASRLFSPPLLAPHTGLNLLLCAVVLSGAGAVSYLLRKRGEGR